jgi:peptidyl-tRNA hydrolase, PTH1 family
VEGGALVVGLGNPGPKYADTRHNLGFMVADALHRRAGGLGWQEKFQGVSSRVDLAGVQALLLKPLTFMNLSGRSVQRASAFFRVPVDKIIVVHDDLDLEFAAIRVKVGGGNGGHKGLVSCAAELGDPGFTRVRIGIGRPPFGDAADYVLQGFSKSEAAELSDAVDRAADAVLAILKDGTVRAMNLFNKKEKAAREDGAGPA